MREPEPEVDWVRGRERTFSGVEEPEVREPLEEGGLSRGDWELSAARSGLELERG